MTTLPLAEVRAALSRFVDLAARTHERIEITRNGRRAAVLLGADDYDALLETLEVLRDQALLRDHLEGAQAIEAGQGVTVDELERTMLEAGRLPHNNPA